MLRRSLKLSPLELALLVVAVAAVAVAIYLWAWGDGAAERRAELEDKVAAAAERLAEEQENGDISSLEEELASLRARLAEECFPDQDQAMAMTDLLGGWVEESGISRIDHQVRDGLEEETLVVGSYSVSRHNLLVSGPMEGLLGFLSSIADSPLTTAVVDNISASAEGGIWNMSLRVTVYYV